MSGPDIAGTASLFADPTRARVLMALVDGRALPASVLAAEACVTPQALSSQLAKLTGAGFLEVERSGRFRYYRIASRQVVAVIEALAPLSDVPPVTSLRASTRAAALRSGRTCYDHLAGRLGVTVTQGLIDREVLVPEDGIADNRRREGDPLSSQLREHPYRLGDTAVLADLGVSLKGSSRRPLLRFCLDWTEQRHHVAGRLGAELLDAFTRAGWVERSPRSRAVHATPSGTIELRKRLGVEAGSSSTASGAGNRWPGLREFEHLIAEIGDQLESSSESRHEAAQHVLGRHVAALDLGNPGYRDAHSLRDLLLGHPSALSHLGEPPAPGVVQHRSNGGLECPLSSCSFDGTVQMS